MDFARLVSAWPLLLLLVSWCPPGTQSAPDHPESEKPDKPEKDNKPDSDDSVLAEVGTVYSRGYSDCPKAC